MDLEPVRPPELAGVAGGPPGRLYRLAWMFYLGIALCGMLWVGLRVGVVPVALFVDLRHWWLDLALGLAAAGLLLALWAAGRARLAQARELEEQLARLMGGLSRSEALALAVLSGFSEELFFRGAVQGAVGWLLASLLFALLHSGPGPSFRLWALFAGIAGALFGGLMAWRGNLLAPVVAHAVVNGVNLAHLAGRGRSARLADASSEEKKES